MSHRFFVSLGLLAAVVILAALSPISVAAQDVTMPRTAWGVPDLQGVWDFRTLTPFERPADLEQDVYTDEERAEFEARRNTQIAGRDDQVPGDIVGNYNPKNFIAFVDKRHLLARISFLFNWIIGLLKPLFQLSPLLTKFN